MGTRQILEDIIGDFEVTKFHALFGELTNKYIRDFKPIDNPNSDRFQQVEKLGEIRLENDIILVSSARIKGDLSEKTSKRAQYELALSQIKDNAFDAGIFVFYGDNNCFRLSLVYKIFKDKKRKFSTYRRFTFFVDSKLPNKTLFQQLVKFDFNSLEGILNVFSVSNVTKDFYNSFEPVFRDIVTTVSEREKHYSRDMYENFVLSFIIRIIFLGFIQKRKWLANKEDFLQDLLINYENNSDKYNSFYADFLEPLFFDALNKSPKDKESLFGKLPPDIATAYKKAPFLNGGLFRVDEEKGDNKLRLSDEECRIFFDFIFSYNFTIEENTLYDQSLELNPEFLGIIFERLVNKESGAIYTPRPEVDLMCRLTLVKWLKKVNQTNVELKDLYELFFREFGLNSSKALAVDQKSGSFSERQREDLLKLLSDVKVCDPAVGSGAFPVGMLQIINEIEEILFEQSGKTIDEIEGSRYERTKRIVRDSLYGFEVKGWAVWICQLRLWITIFLEAPDSFIESEVAILPSLGYKIRQGDSLIQRVGNKLFPVRTSLLPDYGIKEIIDLKRSYYENKIDESTVKARIKQYFLRITKKSLDEIESKINFMNEDVPDQLSLIGGISVSEKPKPKKLKLNFDLKRLEELRELYGQEYKEISKGFLPSVWAIEFCEVFADPAKKGFDIVIGNPPYIMQEDIKDPRGLIKSSKEYKSLLQEMVRMDFPNYFGNNKKIDGRSDLYTYFYIRSLNLLNHDGINTFICSNSWLDANFGSWLQEFLLNRCDINFIFNNESKRTFEEAEINTIISIIDAPTPTPKDDNDHLIKFVNFKDSLDKIIFTENLLDIEVALDLYDNSLMRVYPVKNSDLRNSGISLNEDEDPGLSVGTYTGGKWNSNYFKAPDVYFKILDKCKLEKFNKYFTGERYLNTGGADGFFIVNNFIEENNYFKINNDKTTDLAPTLKFSGKIEKKYIKPLIKDVTKRGKTILITETDAVCIYPQGVDPGDLISKYIEWGEAQGYNLRSVTKNQKPWYKPTRQMIKGAEVLIPRSYGNTFATFYNPKNFLSLRFYRLHPKAEGSEILVAYMNSTIHWLFVEILGNSSQGQGVLDFNMDSFLRSKMPIVRNNLLLEPFKSMSKRSINDIFVECGLDPMSEIPLEDQEPSPLPDRAKLDQIVFDALDLDEKERKDVYCGVCRLVWNRINKADSV